MIKLHLCSGATYLTNYVNCDIQGYVIDNYTNKARYVNSTGTPMNEYLLLYPNNPNETTIDLYFKNTWEPDSTKRKKHKPPFIIDKQFNILHTWPFENDSISEIVMVSCWEHFHHKNEIPHIINEIQRVLKKGGRIIVSFPDVKEQAKLIDSDPEWAYELIYCNNSDQYSRHQWGWNEETFAKQFPNLRFKRVNVINHSYPMIQLEGIRYLNA